jgi:hypothetical protein
VTFAELLIKKEDTIASRWLDNILSTYSDQAAVTFKREKDPFANPVGNSLRLGTQGICKALFGEGALAGAKDQPGEVVTEQIHGYLCEIVKIRAVQEFTASEAVAFVFLLKKAVRDAFGKAAGDPNFSADLQHLDAAVDHIGLAAFDVFSQCREQIFELRMNEVKRRVSWVVGKLNGCRDTEAAPPEQK